MRVYFSACGIGLGHVGRCLPIAKKLKELGASVAFSTYDEGLKYARHEGMLTFKAPPINFRVEPDGTVNFKLTAANPGPFLATLTLVRQVAVEIKAMKAFNPNVVVSDSRISPLIAAKLLGIPKLCLLNQFQVLIPRRKKLLRLARLADYATLATIGKAWTIGSKVLVPDFPPPYTIASGNLHVPRSYLKKLSLIGPILPVRPHELPDEKSLRAKLGLSDKPLVFASVSGPVRSTAYFAKALHEALIKLPDDYQVVMSLGHPGPLTPSRRKNVMTFRWIPNRFEYLKACDLTIARAGHGVITQAMCYGKPMILIPTLSHTEQINNAKRAEEIGIARIIKQDRLNERTLAKAIKEALKGPTVERAKEVQEEVSAWDGLENAVRAILEEVKRGERCSTLSRMTA